MKLIKNTIALGLCALLLLLAGCATPTRNDSDIPSIPDDFIYWKSHTEAMEAYEAIKPNMTLEELQALGFDHKKNPDVSKIGYVRIANFMQPPYDGATPHPGTVKCVKAGNKCFGLLVEAGRKIRNRVNEEMIDLVGMRKQHVTYKWSIMALIIVVEGDGVVITYLDKDEPNGFEIDTDKDNFALLRKATPLAD